MATEMVLLVPDSAVMALERILVEPSSSRAKSMVPTWYGNFPIMPTNHDESDESLSDRTPGQCMMFPFDMAVKSRPCCVPIRGTSCRSCPEVRVDCIIFKTDSW
jgi:hypothetical protein